MSTLSTKTPATEAGKEGRSGLRTSSPWKGFLFSCIACCTAEAATLPIDVVKTRMQLQGEHGAKRVYTGSLNAFSTILKTEGITAWWKGLTPALLRQASYGTLRYGLYEPIKGIMSKGEGDHSITTKILAGTASGAISSSLCNPTDVVKVRMQADMAIGAQRRYANTWQAFVSIAKSEGITGLYRGVGPTCYRASVGAATELATYDELKRRIVNWGVPADVRAHLGASLIAGFVSTLCISPFDVVKSRMMNQPVNPDGSGAWYRSTFDCLRKTTLDEGITALWKGFWPNYARVGPRVVTIFLILEQLRARFD